MYLEVSENSFNANAFLFRNRGNRTKVKYSTSQINFPLTEIQAETPWHPAANLIKVARSK